MNKSSDIKILMYYLDPPLKLRFNESIETKALRFFFNFVIVTYIAATMPTLNSQIKASYFF
jgi:hypothetical protein